MKFVYGKQDMVSMARAQENCWLLTNGLGGFASTSAAYSVTRNDQGLLVSARTAPNDRVNLVHRLSESLDIGGREVYLSTQEFADEKKPEEGYKHLSSFTMEHVPCWNYQLSGVTVQRCCAMVYGRNVSAIHYIVENRGDSPCTINIRPFFQFAPKGSAPQEKWEIKRENKRVSANGLSVYINSSEKIQWTKPNWDKLFYRDDEKDGRLPWGWAVNRCCISKTVQCGEKAEIQILFSDRPCRLDAKSIINKYISRKKRLEQQSGFKSPAARQLAAAADDYIVHRESTGGKTIIAGYPFFGDWGRDTMIALPGCALARKDYDTAKSILRTFLAYEKDGLVPNLFPEGESLPRYNTVDAALLLINSIWLYYEKTGDVVFVKESMPVMERIIEAYKKGTHHGIYMDNDGLISAGQGMDQVTWMDVCVEGILPTPRHGKPVEINAYWYNALRIMERFAALCGKDGRDYMNLAEKVKTSFVEKFWLEEKNCLKDLLSDTENDRQLRCNQIWALTMPFTMLPADKERQVLDAVGRHLYTPLGLRTLSPEDKEYRGFYGGSLKERDLAYHQGTVWTFPLGAYYLAYLKVNAYSDDARNRVYAALEATEAALREGCAGHLPEIYDGDSPVISKGCFAQAWSVGELLRVYEALENGERHEA